MTPKVRVRVRPPGQPHINLALLFRTRLDESDVNTHGLNSRITLYKGLRVFTPGDNAAHFLLQLCSVYSNMDFSHAYLLKFLFFADEHCATPVQDTAQRRHRRRRPVGTRCKDSFQIKTLHKPFLLSLVDSHPRFFTITDEEAGILASAASETFARTWTLGA